MRYLLACLVMLGMSGCGAGQGNPHVQQAEQEKASREGREDSEVRRLAKDAVLACLKYPLDASFGWFDTGVAWQHNRSSVVVGGTVKAPNSFGARLTQTYRVWMQRTEDGWRLLGVTIDGKSVYLAEVDSDGPDDKRIAAREEKQPDDRHEMLAAENAQTETGDRAPAENADAKTEATTEPVPAPHRTEVEVRQWSIAGNEVPARFSGLAGGKVILKTDDGQVLRIALEKLSYRDRAWIEARRKAKQ